MAPLITLIFAKSFIFNQKCSRCNRQVQFFLLPTKVDIYPGIKNDVNRIFYFILYVTEFYYRNLETFLHITLFLCNNNQTLTQRHLVQITARTRNFSGNCLLCGQAFLFTTLNLQRGIHYSKIFIFNFFYLFSSFFLFFEK